MNLGPHAVFIVASYAITAAVVAALVIWIVADYRAQRRALDDLDPAGSDSRERGNSFKYGR